MRIIGNFAIHYNFFLACISSHICMSVKDIAICQDALFILLTMVPKP